jgi:Putative transposase/Transposase zinc-binding domain
VSAVCGAGGADYRSESKLKQPPRSSIGRPALRVADVLRAHATEYLVARGTRASLIEQRVLAQLTACRTAALGGHSWFCDACGEVQVAYNSCRNRHCPTCGGPARARWLDRLRQDILPVPYFHLVFTLPHELSQLALANRRAVYRLLFQSAWQAMRELAADPRHLGARVGALMVLHTWGQNLEHHPHVHCVVPGGGLAPDGSRWIDSRSPKYFLPVQALSRLFRGKFLSALKRLRREGKLRLDDKLAPLADPQRFEHWLTPLYQKDWVVYAQPPVSSRQGPEAVLKYLARYVAGSAISDQRLVSHADRKVTFRIKNYRQGRRQQTLTLQGLEFVRRFLLHVLPRGLVRIRYFGLLANTQRNTVLPYCRKLLGAAPAAAQVESPPDGNDAAEAPASTDSTPRPCPACGLGHLQPLEHWPRPSWRDLCARRPATHRVAAPAPHSPARPPTAHRRRDTS